MPIAYLTRRVRFAAAHRYFRPEWTEERNRAVFGACARPHGHGHNYVLDVTVEGPVDETTGFAVDLSVLDTILREEVVEPLHQRHLNHDVGAFGVGGMVPTTENLLAYLWPKLASRIPGPARLHRLRLHEDDSLWAELYGGDVAHAS